MPRKKAASTTEKPITQYTHDDKDRAYNPPAGLADKDTETGARQQTYAYDPHLSPQLNWAGKAERTSFDVPIVSLHVHERIDPSTIIEAVRKQKIQAQLSLFETEELPLRQAIDFYGHRQNWTNRLIAGDSTLVMNSLLVKEGLAGQVQMIYFDPPYGIKYGSNFQPFVNKRDVKDGKDEDLTAEPETLKAFRDTWELGIHSYLTYLRDRLLLARELLHESGSVFLQISDENVHLVRCLMDEVFGSENFCSLVAFRKKTMPMGSDFFERIGDYIIWYAKRKESAKTKPLFTDGNIEGDSNFRWVELPDKTRRRMTAEEHNNHKFLPKGSKVYRLVSMLPAQYRPNQDFDFEFEGKIYSPPKKSCWKTTIEGMKLLAERRRLQAEGASLQYVLFFDDYPVSRITSIWSDTAGASDKRYVVQTSNQVVARCLLATTDPGDLVLDITCGSGTTAFVAEQWGRRWITCDTSRVALTLAKQRLMTATFDYYRLARPAEGVASGFQYKTVPHVTLKAIANNEPPATETLYDQPLADNAKTRVTGPFTVEAVPAPVVQSISEVALADAPAAHASLARSGETTRQSDLRAELYKTGIRERGGAKLRFSRVEPLPGARFLHADAEVISSQPAADSGQPAAGSENIPSLTTDHRPLSTAARAVVSFGPEHDALSKAQVRRALEEADRLSPKPQFVIFAAYHFDPAAATEIDETAQLYGMTLLKAQMNTDLQTADLKRNPSNESFWLVGQPDARLTDAGRDQDGRKLYRVEVLGFDYFDAKEGKIISGKANNIAVWLLDTDYDGRSLYPRQVFFPLSGDKEGWARLAKNLKAEIDMELIEAYRGKISLPFAAGDYQRAAVKIVDDRGIESIKLIDLL